MGRHELIEDFELSKIDSRGIKMGDFAHHWIYDVVDTRGLNPVLVAYRYEHGKLVNKYIQSQEETPQIFFSRYSRGIGDVLKGANAQ